MPLTGLQRILESALVLIQPPPVFIATCSLLFYKRVKNKSLTMKQWTQMLTQKTALIGAGLLLLAGFGSGCETTGSSSSQSSGSATQARSGDPKKTRTLNVPLISRPTNPGYSGSLPTSNYKV